MLVNDISLYYSDNNKLVLLTQMLIYSNRIKLVFFSKSK